MNVPKPAALYRRDDGEMIVTRAGDWAEGVIASANANPVFAQMLGQQVASDILPALNYGDNPSANIIGTWASACVGCEPPLSPTAAAHFTAGLSLGVVKGILEIISKEYQSQ